MLLFGMKIKIYFYVILTKFLFNKYTSEKKKRKKKRKKKVKSHLYQNSWIELGVLFKQIHSCSQPKGHMLHLKNASSNSNCYPAAEDFMYFNLQQSLGCFEVSVTQTTEAWFQNASRQIHNEQFSPDKIIFFEQKKKVKNGQ